MVKQPKSYYLLFQAIHHSLSQLKIYKAQQFLVILQRKSEDKGGSLIVLDLISIIPFKRSLN